MEITVKVNRTQKLYVSRRVDELDGIEAESADRRKAEGNKQMINISIGQTAIKVRS